MEIFEDLGLPTYLHTLTGSREIIDVPGTIFSILILPIKILVFIPLEIASFVYDIAENFYKSKWKH